MRLLGLIIRDTAATVTAWLVVCGLLCGATLGSYQSSFAEPAARSIAVAQAAHNPSTLLLYGQLPTPGLAAQVFCWEMGSWTTITMAIAGVLFASQLVRGWEQNARLELVYTTGIRPRSFLLVNQVWSAIVAVLLGAVAAVSVGIQHTVAGTSWHGAAAFGGVIAMSFLLPAIITSVCAQITPTLASCRAVGLLIVAAALLLRATGDLRHHRWMGSVSFLGLRGSVQPFTTNHEQPILWWSLMAIALVVVALAILSQREYGSGIIPDRQATRRRLKVRGMWDLAARLGMPAAVTWLAGISVTTALITGMGGGAVSQAQHHTMRGGLLASQLAGTDPAASYLRYVGILVALLASAMGIILIHRTSTDEVSGRAEQVLTTGQAHWKPLVAETLTAVTACLAVTATAAVTTGLVAEHSIEHAHSLTAAAWYAVGGQWAAIMLLVAVASLMAALTPRHAWVTWCIWGATAALTLIGPALHAPTWLINLSPLNHAPNRWTWSQLRPSTELLLLSIVIHATAAAIQNRRDVHTG